MPPTFVRPNYGAPHARHMDEVKGRRDMLARVIRHAAKFRSNWRVWQGRKEIGPQIVCAQLDGRDAG
jgi:hypothetical protein